MERFYLLEWINCLSDLKRFIYIVRRYKILKKSLRFKYNLKKIIIIILYTC